MKTWLVILFIFTSGMAGQPNDIKGLKHNVPQSQPQNPAPTYTYDPNCCTTQASQKDDGKLYRWYAPLEDSNWWLVSVAALTGGLIGWQAWETRKAAESSASQISISQRSMVLQFRPKMLVRFAGLDQKRALFLVTNVGGSIARSVYLGLAFKTTEQVGSLEENVLNLSQRLDGETTWNPGEVKVMWVPLEGDAAQTLADQQDTLKTIPSAMFDKFVYCVGMLSYTDELGIRRVTNIFRTYSHRSGRFEATQDDYAD